MGDENQTNAAQADKARRKLVRAWRRCSKSSLRYENHVTACNKLERWQQRSIPDADVLSSAGYGNYVELEPRPKPDGGPPWHPLSGGSVADILRQHPRPLEALYNGNISAVIVKGALRPSAANEVATRLRQRCRNKGALGLGHTPVKRDEHGDMFSNCDVGQSVFPYLQGGGWKEQTYVIPKAQRKPGRAKKTRRTVYIDTMLPYLDTVNKTHPALRQLMGGIPGELEPERVLHRTVEGLGNGRHTAGPARTGVGDRTYAASRFQVQVRGLGFHVDGLHGHDWHTATKCKHRRWDKDNVQRVTQNSLYTMQTSISKFSIYTKFQRQFASLIELSPPERFIDKRNAEVWIYKTTRHELGKDCSMPGYWHGLGVHVGDRNGTFAKYADQHAIPRWPIKLGQGDLYIFDSGHVHTVSQPIFGDRVKLLAVVGYDPKQREIWTWN